MSYELVRESLKHLLFCVFFSCKSIIGKKSYSFSQEIIRLYKYLVNEQKDFTLSKQILRSGTSIGANGSEALSAESKKDFIHKLSIAQKETKETAYWLHLLFDSDYIPAQIFRELYETCSELSRMLTSIIITMKKQVPF